MAHYYTRRIFARTGNVRAPENWPIGYSPTDEEIAEREIESAHWRAWIDLYDRIEAGHVPATEEVEALATPLFLDKHYPSTPYVALVHETCTYRTRWEVLDSGTVRFEFWTDSEGSYPDYSRRLICRAHIGVRPDGTRYAMVDAHIPLASWGDHRARIERALESAGCEKHEVRRAIEATMFGQPHFCKFDLSRACGVPVAA